MIRLIPVYISPPCVEITSECCSEVGLTVVCGSLDSTVGVVWGVCMVERG